MSRYLLRFAVAILSFTIGLFGVWASSYWSRAEDSVDLRLGNKSNKHPIAYNNGSLPLNYVAERKAVYTQVLKDYTKDDTKTLVILDFLLKRDQNGWVIEKRGLVSAIHFCGG